MLTDDLRTELRTFERLLADLQREEERRRFGGRPSPHLRRLQSALASVRARLAEPAPEAPQPVAPDAPAREPRRRRREAEPAPLYE